MIRSFVCLLFGAVAASGVFFFASRDRSHDSVWWENECEREELQGRIALLNVRLAKREHGFDETRLKEARLRVADLEQRIAALRERARDLEVSASRLEDEFLAVHQNRLKESREAAVGREWTEFVCAGGRTYRNARVVSIDDAGVTLRHEDGSATVRYGDLDESHRTLFGLEKSTAAAAEAEEHRRVAAYGAWVDSETDARDYSMAVSNARSVMEESRRKAWTGYWRKVVPVPPPAPRSLQIGSLSEPARKVGPGRLVYGRNLYTRPRNNVYFYPYTYGGGCYSPGYSNGIRSGWTIVRPPIIRPPLPKSTP